MSYTQDALLTLMSMWFKFTKEEAATKLKEVLQNQKFDIEEAITLAFSFPILFPLGGSLHVMTWSEFGTALMCALETHPKLTFDLALRVYRTPMPKTESRVDHHCRPGWLGEVVAGKFAVMSLKNQLAILEEQIGAMSEDDAGERTPEFSVLFEMLALPKALAFSDMASWIGNRLVVPKESWALCFGALKKALEYEKVVIS
jgi:hypothetical protein